MLEEVSRLGCMSHEHAGFTSVHTHGAAHRMHAAVLSCMTDSGRLCVAVPPAVPNEEVVPSHAGSARPGECAIFCLCVRVYAGLDTPALWGEAFARPALLPCFP